MATGVSSSEDDVRSLRADLEKLKEEHVAAERRVRNILAVNRRSERPSQPSSASARNERRKRRSPPRDDVQPKRRRRELPPEASRPGPQRAYESDPVRARSKRMFGALMGHLGRAKTTLDSDATVTKQQNKQREATEKAEAEEKSRRELQSLEWKVEHGAAVDERDRVSTDIRIAEARLQHAAWMKSRAPFDRRIRTKAQPSLAWLPKRHTDKTRRILEESCDAERAEIVARTAINDEKIRELKAGLEERKLKRKQATEITNAKLEAMQRDGEVERRRRELSHPDERDSVDAAIPEDEKTEGK